MTAASPRLPSVLLLGKRDISAQSQLLDTTAECHKDVRGREIRAMQLWVYGPQGSLKPGQSGSLQTRPTVKARDIDVDGSPYRLCRQQQCIERRKETTRHRTGKARMVFTKDRARNRCTA